VSYDTYRLIQEKNLILDDKERHLMLFPTLGPSSLLVVVAQPDERHNRIASVLEWYDRYFLF